MANSYDHLQESGEPRELGPSATQLAGDVVELPGNSYQATSGKHFQPDASKYNSGAKSDPKVLPIGQDKVNDWRDRIRSRQ